MVRLTALVIALALTSTLPAAAYAEDGADRAEARALFEQGLALGKAGRWNEALSAFKQSNELVPRASTSYNVANALYRLGRPADAIEELDRLDRMPNPGGNGSSQARSVELRALAVQSVAEVALTIRPSSAALHVDGSRSTLSGGERVLRLNPGRHFVQVSQEGHHPESLELDVERGSRRSIVVELRVVETGLTTSELWDTEPSLAPTSPSEPAEPDDRKRFVKSPGFWVLIGVIGAAAVGAGVAIAVTRRNDAPACGTTGDCATTQGLGVAF